MPRPVSLSPSAVWLLLLAATGLSLALGQFGRPGPWLIVGVLVVAFCKGLLVILEFMELAHAPALWRRLVVGWLLLVGGAIVYIYLR